MRHFNQFKGHNSGVHEAILLVIELGLDFILIYNFSKFGEVLIKTVEVESGNKKRTKFCDGRTDGRTDRRTG